LFCSRQSGLPLDVPLDGVASGIGLQVFTRSAMGRFMVWHFYIRDNAIKFLSGIVIPDFGLGLWANSNVRGYRINAFSYPIVYCVQ